MQTDTTIEIMGERDEVISVTVYDGNALYNDGDITLCGIYFSAEDKNGQVFIEKRNDVAGGDSDQVDMSLGSTKAIARVLIRPSDTKGKKAGYYAFDVAVKLPTGEIKDIESGKLYIQRPVTRNIS